MRKLSIALLIVLLAIKAKADYGYMSLSELICEADYGVIGRIVKLDENYFYIKVDSVIMGAIDEDTVAIIKFVDWPCAKRYKDYEVGQKEIVFFRRSNYVIDDFEYLGYGAGDEFELPIINDSTLNYQIEYGKLKSYGLQEFITAVQDYSILKKEFNSTSKTISKGKQMQFAGKSTLHKMFIECKKRSDYARSYQEHEMPKVGVIADIEKRFLYTDYENKIRVVFSNAKPIKYYIKVEDAEVRREKDYFIVKPKSGWTRRYINVYKENTDSILFNQIFEVIDLPEPRIYFGDHWHGDTVEAFTGYISMPRAYHYLDDMHHDEDLDYKLLSYDYIIRSGNSIDTIHCKSAGGNNAFRERTRQIKDGDTIEVANVYVQYPNNAVVKIKGRKVYFKKPVRDK